MGTVRQITLHATATLLGGEEEKVTMLKQGLTGSRSHPQYVHLDNPEIITRKSC